MATPCINVTPATVRIDPEFQALIPPLADEELAGLEANRLGFEGETLSDLDLEVVRLMPTPMGRWYWLWSHMSLKTGIETYSRKPTALSRIPLSEWRHFKFTACPMEPAWEYPPLYSESKAPRLINVYFIQGITGGPVKIGFAVNADDRLAQLQAGNPVQLRIVRLIKGVTPADERKLHRKFSHHWLRGEWFSEKVLDLYGGGAA